MTEDRSSSRFTDLVRRSVGPYLRFALVFSALVNLLYLAPSLYMMQIYDRVIPSGGLTTLALLTLIVLGALALLAYLDQIRSKILLHGAVKLDQDILPELLNASLSVQGGSANASYALRQFDLIRQTLSGSAITAVFDAPWTPIYILVAALIHPLLGALVLGGGLLLVALAVANDKATRRAFEESSAASADSYATQEALDGSLETIQALGMKDALAAEFTAARQASVVRSVTAGFVGASYGGAIRFLRLALQSILLAVSAWLAVKGEISAGAIVAAGIMGSRALVPVDSAVSNWRTLVESRTALKTLNALLSNTPSPAGGTLLPAPKGRLSVDGVSVLSAGGRPLLDNISFSVEGPAIVAVVGASGAGKTTLLQVLANARAPSAGQVRLDGASYADWPPAQLVRFLGYAPQENHLFQGTVKDNISRFAAQLEADVKAVDADVIAAAEAASAHEFILGLPRGYDTMIGPRGSGLSTGQQQRIALVRALFRSPRILVLDEPNAALDAEGEQRLVTALTAARAGGALVIVSAHKSSIVGLADYVVVLRDGALINYGPRDEVIGRPPTALAGRRAGT